MRRLPVALVATALILAPFGVGRVYSVYDLNLLTWILIFALFAAALDLALGYGGLVSRSATRDSSARAPMAWRWRFATCRSRRGRP